MIDTPFSPTLEPEEPKFEMAASAEIFRIRHFDRDWHDPLFVAVEGIFRCGETFRRWAQMGGWNESYEPAVRPIRRLDLVIPADRALLADYCTRAAPINGQFAARDYFPIMLWNLIHSPRQIVLTNDLAAVLVVSQVDELLTVHDLFAPSVFDLIQALASVIDAPVEGIEFCFDPGEWLSAVSMKVESYREDPCFILWSGNLSPGNCRFPDLAHT